MATETESNKLTLFFVVVGQKYTTHKVWAKSVTMRVRPLFGYFGLYMELLLKSSHGLCPRVSSGKRELVCVFLVHMFFTCYFFFSSSWCRGLAAVCDCGTPWTFLLSLLVSWQGMIRLPEVSDEMELFVHFLYCQNMYYNDLKSGFKI